MSGPYDNKFGLTSKRVTRFRKWRNRHLRNLITTIAVRTPSPSPEPKGCALKDVGPIAGVLFHMVGTNIFALGT